MGTRKLSEDKQAAIAKVQSQKNARRKKRKAQNARLRDSGEKFGTKDACYNG